MLVSWVVTPRYFFSPEDGDSVFSRNVGIFLRSTRITTHKTDVDIVTILRTSTFIVHPKTFGAKKAEVTEALKKLNNEELRNLFSSPNIQ
jgi:hypothetical protein